MNEPVTIYQVHPRDIWHLVQQLDTFQTALYPTTSNHLDTIESLSKSTVYFVGAFMNHEALGCGAVKMLEQYGEIKRMYVRPIFRGCGIGKRILTALEEFLIKSGITLARLETGVYQNEALALYEHSGYRKIFPFGDYSADPLSVFMEKNLSKNNA